MKGILLAGGSGSRLYPLTKVVNKQLLPVYDKPLICYPLSTLMLAGIKDILIISNGGDLLAIQKFLGDGVVLGLNIEYAVQEQPKGIPEAFIIGEKFLDGESVCLILGDNIFYSQNLSGMLKDEVIARKNLFGASIVVYPVTDPERFGVAEVDDRDKVLSVEEKPIVPKSNLAITGLYFFDNSVIEIAKKLKPSKRGELEIVDIIKDYLSKDLLDAKVLGRGSAWLDAGTKDSLFTASNFIQMIEKIQNYKIGCIEEIAYRQKFISREDLFYIAERMPDGEFKTYLRVVADESC